MDKMRLDKYLCDMTSYTRSSIKDILKDKRVKVNELVVKDGTTVLIKDTDYTVSYSNNINAGTATATISKVANSNYTFSDANKAFTINKYEK